VNTVLTQSANRPITIGYLRSIPYRQINGSPVLDLSLASGNGESSVLFGIGCSRGIRLRFHDRSSVAPFKPDCSWISAPRRAGGFQGSGNFGLTSVGYRKEANAFGITPRRKPYA